MEITFKNIEANQVPVFILSMAHALKEYEAGNTSKKELLAFYGDHFVADNTTSSITIDGNFSVSVKYLHEKHQWTIDKYPAVDSTVSFIDLAPKAPCTCCGK
jgi:hypothetical protein